MNTAETYHIPVLLRESVDGVNINPSGTYVDMTYGGGGHSREILSRLGTGGRLFGFDQDEDAMANIVDDKRLTFVRSNFMYLKNWMRYYGVDSVDGIIADLGVSSHHFDDESRGFSFRYDSPLDMRMNRKAGTTAADILATYSEKQIADVLYLYGELKNARRIAAAIVKAREAKPIATTGELKEVVEPFFRFEREKKDMARVFQALRIEVNHEMEALTRMLNASAEVLRAGGRLVVITYHSLEDRIVKNIIRSGNVDGKTRQDFYGNVETPFASVTTRIITPSDEEMRENPRSRSAKLRIAEKK